jgi:hypothetical protein
MAAWTMIAFSAESTFNVQLPASGISLVVIVRDTFDCATEFNLSSIQVIVDHIEIDHFLDLIQASNNDALDNLTQNNFGQRLVSGNQNTISQAITSLAVNFNERAADTLQTAIDSRCASSCYLTNYVDSLSQMVCQRWMFRSLH